MVGAAGAGLAGGAGFAARGLGGDLPGLLLLLLLLLLLVAGRGAGLADGGGDGLADVGGGGLPLPLVLVLLPPLLSVLLPPLPRPLPDVLLELMACGVCGDGDGDAGCDGGVGF